MNRRTLIARALGMLGVGAAAKAGVAPKAEEPAWPAWRYTEYKTTYSTSEIALNGEAMGVYRYENGSEINEADMADLIWNDCEPIAVLEPRYYYVGHNAFLYVDRPQRSGVIYPRGSRG